MSVEIYPIRISIIDLRCFFQWKSFVFMTNNLFWTKCDCRYSIKRKTERAPCVVGVIHLSFKGRKRDDGNLIGKERKVS